MEKVVEEKKKENRRSEEEKVQEVDNRGEDSGPFFCRLARIVCLNFLDVFVVWLSRRFELRYWDGRCLVRSWYLFGNLFVLFYGFGWITNWLWFGFGLWFLVFLLGLGRMLRVTRFIHGWEGRGRGW